MATATVMSTPPPEMIRLRAAMRKRGIAPHRIAKQLNATKDNPNRIYQILRGTRPAPSDFLDHVCGLTGIPLSAVLEPEDSQALSEYLRDVAYDEDLQRMGNGY